MNSAFWFLNGDQRMLPKLINGQKNAKDTLGPIGHVKGVEPPWILQPHINFKLQRFFLSYGLICNVLYTISDLAKEGEEWEALKGSPGIVLGRDGRVWCYAKEGRTLIRRSMHCWGFDPKRQSTKWRCPAVVHNQRCPERWECSKSAYGRTVWVRCEKDWRRFGPMAHGTKQRERLYNGRTACERVISRLKIGLTLDDLHVRGKARIGLRTNLALIALLGMAYGQLKMNAKAWRRITRVAH